MTSILDKILSQFELEYFNFDSSNRKTLLDWVRKTKFQEAVLKVLESCETGKHISRVQMCKKRTRPELHKKDLKLLDTKELRKRIKDFIKHIGLDKLDKVRKLSGRKLDEYASKYHWNTCALQVVWLLQGHIF